MRRSQRNRSRTGVALTRSSGGEHDARLMTEWWKVHGIRALAVTALALALAAVGCGDKSGSGVAGGQGGGGQGGGGQGGGGQGGGGRAGADGPAAAGSGGGAGIADSGGGDVWAAPDVFNPDPRLLLPSEGRRLKIRWTRGPDGQLAFDSFRDTQLDTDCGFFRAADGEWRCLPFGFFLGTAPIDFADSGCTEPAFVDSRPTCNKHRFVRRQDSTTNPCDTRYRIYKVGEELPADRVYWRPAPTPPNTETVCKLGGILPMAAAFRVGEELPVSMFVKAKRAPRADGHPVEAVVLEAEDGARVDSGWYLPAASGECSVIGLQDGRLRCVPDSVSESTAYFADNVCTQRPTVGHQPACGPVPRYVRRVDPASCSGGVTLMDVGSRLESLFRTIEGVCAAVNVPIGLQYHRVGQAAATEMLPLFENSQEGSHRIQRRKLGSATGWRLGANWYDSQRMEWCARAWYGDRHRCSPTAAALGSFYADLNCTQPIFSRTRSTCAPPKYARNFQDNSCPQREQLWTVGAEYTGEVFRRANVRYENQAELECQPVTRDANTLYHSVTRVADTELAELAVVEPG